MLCGILVDEGKLKWSQTLGETFPSSRNPCIPSTRPSRSNNSDEPRRGAGESKDALWGELWQLGDAHERAAARLRAIRPSQRAPARKFIYSNAGFSIAGHMAGK